MFQQIEKTTPSPEHVDISKKPELIEDPNLGIEGIYQRMSRFAIDAVNSEIEKIQIKRSYPNSDSTYIHAHNDNMMIDKNTAKIQKEEKIIAENAASGIYSKESLRRANLQIIPEILTLSNDINLIKTTRINSDDIKRRERGDLKEWHKVTKGRII